MSCGVHNLRKGVFGVVGMLNYTFVVFLNAFTDLGHKIIIQNTVFKVYDGDVQIMLTAIVNALILLPFILMFSPAGFLSDRFAKSKIMQYSALFAVVITLLITYAYYQGWFLFAFAMTFLLALQSALYSPAKYGYIKELVGVKFISACNGVVQAVTTVAILGGIITYTVLFESLYSEDLVTKEMILQAIAPLGWLLVAGSVIEFFMALQLPNTQKEVSNRQFHLRRYVRGAYLFKNIKTITRKKEIFDAIIALSLFWSISQVVLAVFGEYAKNTLGVTNTIFVQGVMALAAIGIVIGSIMAAKLSKYYINLGLSGIGAVAITGIVFIVPNCDSMTLIALLFVAFGFFAGFILVPLNSQIQNLAPNVHLGTILAANNFVQNIFMFSFLILTTIFAYMGMDAEILFYCMGLLGIYLTVLLFKHYLVEIFWSFVTLVLSLRYNVVYQGVDNLPKEGGVLLLSNHVSWLDWALLQLPIKRPINYLMDKEIYNNKLLNPILKKGEVLPLSPKGFKDAMLEASNRLKNGKIVGLFPEGQIAKTSRLNRFNKGFELIQKQSAAVIVPVYIGGMAGSVFAKYKKKKKRGWLRRKVIVCFAQPITSSIDAVELQTKVQMMKERCEAQ